MVKEYEKYEVHRTRRGRVKVHIDGRMSAQQEFTVEILLSARMETWPYIHIHFL